jgi:hypothetical protein
MPGALFAAAERVCELGSRKSHARQLREKFNRAGTGRDRTDNQYIGSHLDDRNTWLCLRYTAPIDVPVRVSRLTIVETVSSSVSRWRGQQSTVARR